MGKNLLVILLMGVTTLLFAQTIAPKKCNICGNPLGQCKYKGRHPKPASNQTTIKQSAQTPKPDQLAKQTSGHANGHDWIDLGLPSGTKWATMNVGASSPSDYGSYFAWGETSPKSSYDWENQRYRNSGDRYNNVKFSKYVTDSKDGSVDDKRDLDLSDDAAYVNWGARWCMPSCAQQDELRENCKWKWTSRGGHNGYKVVGPNGNSIFLPAAGLRDDISSRHVGLRGYYWARTLFTSDFYADYLGFYSEVIYFNWGERYYGCSVRAVLAF